MVFAEFVLNLITDGTQVRFAGASGNDEIVGDRRDLANVQDHDVLGLSPICQLPAEQGQFP
jgi:hypothetical protein